MKTSASWGDAASHHRGAGKPAFSSKTRTAQFPASVCSSRWTEWFHFLASSPQLAGDRSTLILFPCIGANQQPVLCHRCTISSERSHFYRLLLPPSPREKLLPVLSVVVLFYTHGRSGTTWVCRQGQASEGIRDTAGKWSDHLPGSRGLAPWTVLAPRIQQLLVKYLGSNRGAGKVYPCLSPNTHLGSTHSLKTFIWDLPCPHWSFQCNRKKSLVSGEATKRWAFSMRMSLLPQNLGCFVEE